MTDPDRARTDDAAATRLTIHDEHLELPRDVDPAATYDVLLNDDHVWSLQPARDARRRAGMLIVPWPKALHRYLSGRATVVLRSHVTGEVVATGEHAFGGVTDRDVAVVDRAGNALILDKYNRLTRPLSAENEATIDHLMDQVEALLETLRERAGVPAFVSYGTLLGAVRNGQLIGHDNDIDLSYVSLEPTPVDVLREAYRVERAVRADGWIVRRGSGARLNVRLPQQDGTLRYVDVFTAHWVEGVFYTPQDTGFELPRETILPLTSVELLGRQVPAPADYERLLAATYGPGWRTPDPSFKYETPRWLARRIGGWFGGLRAHRKQWDEFYGREGRRLTTEPSPFATWVQEFDPSTRPLLDIGAGNCRDSLWFARQGRAVTALDFCLGVLDRTVRGLGPDDPHLQTAGINLYDTREVLALGTTLARATEPTDLYCRFTYDAVEEIGRDNVLRLASMTLRRGGHLYLEFRTPRDQRRPHHFEHARNFLSPRAVVRAIEERGGTVVHRVSGTGLAPFEDEDPHVCRIVATWARG